MEREREKEREREREGVTLRPNAHTMSSEIMSLEHPLSVTIGWSTPLPPDSLLCTPQWTVAVSTSPLVHSYLSCSVYIFFSFRLTACCDSHLCFFGCICSAFLCLSSSFFFCLYFFNFSFFLSSLLLLDPGYLLVLLPWLILQYLLFPDFPCT